MYVLQIVVCFQWCSCYSIFSLYVCFVDRCLFLVVFVLLDLQFICMFCRSLFVFSGVRVTRSLVYMYVLQIVVCFQWCSCYSIFSLYVCFVDRCLFLVVFVLLDLQFSVYVLQIIVCFQWCSCYSIFSFMCMFCRSLFVFSGVRVTSLVFYVCFVDLDVCFQWCSCYQIFSLYVCFVDRCLFLVVFVLLDLQFSVYVLQIVVCFYRCLWCSCYSIFSFMCFVDRCLQWSCYQIFSLYVCFVDRCLFLVVFVLLDLQFYMYVLQIVVCFQWCSCYLIFSLYVCFVDRCLFLVVFVLLDLQFICMFCRSLFVFSGVRVTRSLVYMYVLQIVVCFQWCSCYLIFSLYVCFVDRCLFLVVFVLLDLQFICMFCRSLFVFSGVRVTRSLVYMYVLQIVVCFQWCSCYQIFSLYVCFVDRCLFLVVFVLLDLQFYMYVLQIVVCFQWCSCYQIFSLYVCFVDRCLFLVVFVLLDLQFICMFCRSLFVFSGVRVTRSLVYMYVLQIVVCFQWCSCYQIFSLYVCFVDRCLFLVVFVLLDLQFICMFCRSLFVFSGVRVTRSLVYMYVLQIVVCFQWCSCYLIFSLYVCFVDRCLFLVVFVLLDLQFYMYVLQIVVCFQWCSCYSIFSLYVCFVDRCLFLVVFVLLDLQFICMFCRSLFVFSGVRVTRSLVYMYVLQIVVCFQWCSCYQIFSLYVCFVDRCLFLVVFVLLDLQFICMFCRSLFVFSGVRVT